MATWVAMLRGVNVGGKTLKMDALRASLGEAGWGNVRTYLQSGNVVFEAKGTASALASKIESTIARVFGLEVGVIVRKPSELAAVIEANPFLKEPGIDRTKLHVTFLREKPTKAGLSKLASIDAGGDRWEARGTEIYLHCPDGYGRSKLSNAAIERALAVMATTRNWNSVNALNGMGAGG